VFHHLTDDAHALEQWLADLDVVAVLAEQHVRELDALADFHVAIIDFDHFALADTVLPRAVFKNCVHIEARP
jgi:hypothetical protein